MIEHDLSSPRCPPCSLPPNDRCRAAAAAAAAARTTDLFSVSRPTDADADAPRARTRSQRLRRAQCCKAVEDGHVTYLRSVGRSREGGREPGGRKTTTKEPFNLWGDRHHRFPSLLAHRDRNLKLNRPSGGKLLLCCPNKWGLRLRGARLLFTQPMAMFIWTVPPCHVF